VLCRIPPVFVIHPVCTSSLLPAILFFLGLFFAAESSLVALLNTTKRPLLDMGMGADAASLLLVYVLDHPYWLGYWTVRCPPDSTTPVSVCSTVWCVGDYRSHVLDSAPRTEPHLEAFCAPQCSVPTSLLSCSVCSVVHRPSLLLQLSVSCVRLPVGDVYKVPREPRLCMGIRCERAWE
jgi:hypothetical protein